MILYEKRRAAVSEKLQRTPRAEPRLNPSEVSAWSRDSPVKEAINVHFQSIKYPEACFGKGCRLSQSIELEVCVLCVVPRLKNIHIKKNQ